MDANGGTGPISRVTPGMRVVDSAGEEVGTVELVKMGDPAAATAQGQTDGRDGGLVGLFRDAFGQAEPDLPPALAERFLRTGFVKIDAKGLFARDVYVGPEQIAEAGGDTVRLAATRDDLAKES